MAIKTGVDEVDKGIGFLKYLIPIIIIGVLLFNSFTIVDAGYRGVLLTFGKPSTDVIEEGLAFKIPFVQNIKTMEVRTQKIESQAASASKDLQYVTADIALNFHVNPEEVPTLYTDIGLTYRSRIIDPAIQESVKSVSSKYTAEELITKRQDVSTETKDFLRERLLKYHIIVDDFNIANFEFSEEFNDAIEAKVTAEQLKLKAERDLERIKIEKEQKITQAEAEAESIRIQSEALKENKDILELRAIEKWDGILPVVVGNAVPFIGLNDITSQNVE